MRTRFKALRSVCLLILGLGLAYFGLFFCVMEMDEAVWREGSIEATCAVRWSEYEYAGGPRGTVGKRQWSAWNGVFQPAEIIVNRIRGHENRLQEYRDQWYHWIGYLR